MTRDAASSEVPGRHRVPRGGVAGGDRRHTIDSDDQVGKKNKKKSFFVGLRSWSADMLHVHP